MLHHKELEMLDKLHNGNKFDNVDRPEHYNKFGIECITAIKASMSDEEFKGYLKGNLIKYTWRYSYKSKPLEDLKKAKWYLNKLIEEIENEK